LELYEASDAFYWHAYCTCIFQLTTVLLSPLHCLDYDD